MEVIKKNKVWQNSGLMYADEPYSSKALRGIADLMDAQGVSNIKIEIGESWDFEPTVRIQEECDETDAAYHKRIKQEEKERIANEKLAKKQKEKLEANERKQYEKLKKKYGDK